MIDTVINHCLFYLKQVIDILSLALSFFLSLSFTCLESDKCRDLFEAIEYPQKTMFEDVHQFPPVTAVRAE